jgi:hypothetical protein
MAAVEFGGYSLSNDDGRKPAIASRVCSRSPPTYKNRTVGG